MNSTAPPDCCAFSASWAPLPAIDGDSVSVGKPVVDKTKKTVSITLPNGVVRTAVYTGGQGCVTYPEGSTTLSFTPKSVKPNLPPAASQDWPLGDREPKTPLAAGIDMEKVIPNRALRLDELPIAPWNSPGYEDCYEDLAKAAKKYGLRLLRALNDCRVPPRRARSLLR